MATCDIKWDGREFVAGRDPNAKLTTYVHYDPDTEDEDDWLAAVLATTPATYRGQAFSFVTFTEHAYDVVKAVVSYSSQRPAPDTSGAAEPEFSFEISSRQVKIFASLAVVSSGNASGKTAPNHGNLIGVKPDGTIEGTDVPQMEYSFSETHHFNAAAVTNSYKIALAGLVGKVNNGSFRGFAAGEVLCTGVSGSRRGNDLWQIRFQWAVLPNEASLTIGPLSGIVKAGWDFLELFHSEKTNATTKKIERELIGYKVHRVLKFANYAGFGIGTS